MRVLRAGFRVLRVAIPLLYLIEVGILLPLHVHEPAASLPGLVLAAGCHAGLPCADPEHHHPPAPDEHATACAACATAHRPVLAASPADPAVPALSDRPLSAALPAVVLSRAPQSASVRAPPALLPA